MFFLSQVKKQSEAETRLPTSEFKLGDSELNLKFLKLNRPHWRIRVFSPRPGPRLRRARLQ